MIRIILIALLFVVACNSPEPANTDAVAAKEDTITELRYVAKTPLVSSGCYGWAIAGDTATLQLSITENRVTGSLIYDWSEKDRNSGSLQGVLQDSLIVANYTYESEGRTSVREVVFKIKADSLIEGFGDVNTKGDVIEYKDKDQLQFHDDRPFVKGVCGE